MKNSFVGAAIICAIGLGAFVPIVMLAPVVCIAYLIVGD